MDITWLGNSTFLIKTSIGKRILIDPLTKFNNHNLDILNPNITTISKFSYIAENSCSFNTGKIISSSGYYSTEIGEIRGYETFSDNLKGAKRGSNIIYTYNIDNLNLCHLGYIGEVISTEFINKLGAIDILFIPVGGHINLNGKEAFNLCKKINPKVIIPMNFKSSYSSFLFNSIDDFALLKKNIYKVSSKSLSISKDTILSNGNVFILKDNISI